MAADPSLPKIVPEVLCEDDHIIAVVKPAGLPTANAMRGQRSLFAELSAKRPSRAFLGVVSRLDAAVSGVVVLAKTRAAAADLSRQFRERLVEKSYAAIVEGRFPAALGTWVEWHDSISRSGDERRSRLGPAAARAGADDQDDAPDEAGDACHVSARVTRRMGEVSLVELRPSSGRRHQLRVQLSGRGCPIVGDRTYGARLPFPSVPGLGAAIALHARGLVFGHPATGKPVALEAGWPATWLQRYPELCRGRG